MTPTEKFADDLHAEKYRGKGESFEEAMQRVASALSDGEEHYREFRGILQGKRFLPAGRVQAAMGSTKQVTPYNCYVSGTIEDSFVDGNGSIMDRAKEAAATMRMGGGIGYDFSSLRPRGDTIRKLDSRSSGPVSFMDIFDSVCRCIASSGHRRGAQMGVLRVDHPDIEEFLHAKQNDSRLTGFNISIAVTDAFMRAVVDDCEFDLQWGGQVYRTIKARPLWENIMRSTWDWAEPGILFIDTINKYNNLWYCEKIAATNPCGEQPLPPHGACLLGSFNLTQYVSKDKLFKFAQFTTDIRAVVRAMDNIVDRAIYPLYEQEKEAKSKRRMGLGVTGLANALESMGHPYGSRGFLKLQEEILFTLNHVAYDMSMDLAAEKGAFPLFDYDLYKQSLFLMKSGLADVPGFLEKMERCGMRNSHLTSIAPTGTISMTAGNVSSGIEPVFSEKQERVVQTFDGPSIQTIEDYGYARGVKAKTTDQVTIKEHLAVLATAQRYVDSAVSKTCNVDPNMPWEEFKQIYIEAWYKNCKGCTTFNIGGKRMGILKDAGKDDDEDSEPASACYIDPTTGKRECE